MGLMQGKVQGDSLVIMDSFALPVQGTETRVNAGNEAIEYMVQYTGESEKVSRTSSCLYKLSLTPLLGWTTGKRDWLVSLPSWLWMLAIWYRCLYPDDEPEIPGPLRRRSCT